MDGELTNLPTATALLEALPEIMGADTAELRKRLDDLEAAFKRMPPAVGTEDTAAKVTTLIAQINACAKALEDARKKEKEPFDKGAKAVQGFFTPLLDRLKTVKDAATRRLDAWQRQKDAERRAEAERLRQEAAAQAAKAQTAEEVEQATALAEQAKAADGPHQTRTEYGNVASTRKRWTFEVEDLAQVPRGYLVIDGVAVNKAIHAATDKKTGACTLAIPGLRIFQETSTVVKG